MPHRLTRRGAPKSLAPCATAYSGFRVAVLESATLRVHGVDVVIHTGYWGCGAFGGNRVLMALLQVIAARLAGIDRLVFHTGLAGGEVAFAQALAMFDALVTDQDAEVAALIEVIHAYGFEWGVSDGN